MEYLETNFKVDLKGKKKVSLTEQEEWNRLSNEEKFSDAFSKLPLMILAYGIELGTLICIGLFGA